MSSLLAEISAPEWGCISLFLLWTLLTVIFQFTGTRIKVFIPLAILGLLPSWNFFAPRPGTSDYHLLYRDRLADGMMSPWREIPLETPQWWMALWNPHMRKIKALSDVVRGFQTLLDQSTEQPTPLWFEVSVPYLLLLHAVTYYPHLIGADAVQFLVMCSPDGLFESEPEVLFLSRLHPLSTKQISLAREEAAIIE